MKYCWVALMMIGVLVTGCFSQYQHPNGNLADGGQVEEVKKPLLNSISSLSLKVGDPVQFTGANFINDNRATTRLTFRGTFHRAQGGTETVHFVIEPSVVNANTVLWERFGPYRVPFSTNGNHIGTFKGEILAANVLHAGGQLIQDGSLPVEIQVQPSIIVKKFEAVGASCLKASPIILDHVPYVMEVEAIGFAPTSFNYTISAGALLNKVTTNGGASDPVLISHQAAGQVDKLGEQEYFNFAPVPEGLHGYNASISVTANTLQGNSVSYFLPITIRRPLEIRYDGNVEAAQIYQAVPVSGCLFGDVTGRTVNYTETHSEIKERGFTIGFSTNWQTTYTQAHTDSYGQGGAQANSVGFTTTDGINVGWSLNAEVGGEVGIGKLAKVGVKVGTGVSFGRSHTESMSGDRTVSANWSYNEAVSESQSASQSVTESGSQIWRVSSTDSESLNYQAQLLPNMYGVFYRQVTRLISTMKVVAYDLCGNWSVVGSMSMSNYTWAPDMAMSSHCPPFPTSNLPAKACLKPPCVD